MHYAKFIFADGIRGTYISAYRVITMHAYLHSGLYSHRPFHIVHVYHGLLPVGFTFGTGRFAGATGAFTGIGTLDRSVPRPLSQLELSGTLDLLKVPEPTGLGLLVGGAAMIVMTRRRRRAHPLA